MQVIPTDILEQYSAVLKKRAIPVSRYADYRKWLRYFLDFRSKYPLPESRSEQVRLFILKLREKKQSPDQQKQAAHVLSLFFESQPRLKPDAAKQANVNPEFSNIQAPPAGISVSELQSDTVDNPVPNEGATSEVDYLIVINDRLVPVEVKSGKTGNLRSLHNFIDESSSDFARGFTLEI